jgi:hypothetical protein
VALRPLARRQRAVKFAAALPALLLRREQRLTDRIDLMLPFGSKQTMRWKISRHGHDSRQIDLLAVLALLIIIVAACRYFGQSPDMPSTTALIVPSQSTRW